VQAQFDRQQQLGVRTIDYSFGANNDDNDAYIVTNTTSYDFGNVTLKNIFGYYHQTPEARLGQTSTNIPLVDVIHNKNQEAISDELQLNGDTGSLKWIVGGFYSRQKTATYQKSWLFGGLANEGTSYDTYTSKALFAQGTYDFSTLGLEGLKFTAGIRHSWDSRSGILDVGTFTPAGVFVPTPQYNNSRKDKEWSWTLGLDYQVTPDVLLYVVSRHSYKAGGLNLVSNIIPPELLTYEPEKLTDLEVGVKTTIRAGEAQIRTNIAAYTGWYSNAHTQELANCGSVASYIVNAAKGRPKGLEFEFDAAVTPRFRLGGFYNLTLGKFPTFNLVKPAGCAVIGGDADLNGTDFPNINKHTAGLNAAYTLPLSQADEDWCLAGTCITARQSSAT